MATSQTVKLFVFYPAKRCVTCSYPRNGIRWKKKNSELGLPTRCFFFLLIYYWLKWGQKLTKKDNKKAHISNTLAGGEIQALESANADQHSNRITRFATLKHRAKNQENYLFTLAKFKRKLCSGCKKRWIYCRLKICPKIEWVRKLSAIQKFLYFGWN